MSNSSNQSGVLALLAIVLAAIFYGTMFLGSEMEQKNLSESYGTITLPSSNLSSSKTKSINDKYAGTENRSDLSGVSLPAFKKENSKSANYTESGEVAFPTSEVAPIDVQIQSSRKQNIASTRNDGAYLRNQLVGSAIVSTTDVQYISTTPIIANKDIDASFMLIQARNVQTSTTNQGSKRVTQKAASSSSSTDVNGKQNSKKAPGDPGDPGASLPIGDGVWLMLMFASVYSLISLMTKQMQLKAKEIK